jgi:hypothetical protein
LRTFQTCLLPPSSAVVWDVEPYGLAEIDRRFTGAYVLQHLIVLMMKAISMSQNVGKFSITPHGAASLKTGIIKKKSVLPFLSCSVRKDGPNDFNRRSAGMSN